MLHGPFHQAFACNRLLLASCLSYDACNKAFALQLEADTDAILCALGLDTTAAMRKAVKQRWHKHLAEFDGPAHQQGQGTGNDAKVQMIVSSIVCVCTFAC